MRHHCQTQPDLQLTPSEKIRLPLRSRDELPPILAGLQWLWMHPTLQARDPRPHRRQNPRGQKSRRARPALELKVDSCVLETDAHFPTGLNLLPDAGRKCVDWIEKLRRSGCALSGWRKAREWRRQLKNLQRTTSQIVYRGGPNKESRVKSAVRDCLAAGSALCAKVHASLIELCDQPVDAAHWAALEYFQHLLAKHPDLVERRLLNEETIPAHEKVFSLFEPHTEWIQKDKQRPNVELGRKLLLAPDQNQLIQDCAVLLGEAEGDQSIPVADRLLGRYGAGRVASISFDKGFTREADRQLLGLCIPEVIMAQARQEERGGGGTRKRKEICGVEKAAQRRGGRDQQPGTPRIEPLPGRGNRRPSEVCGPGRAELQPARHQAGTAGAGTGAIRTGAPGGLKAAPHETPGQVRQERCRRR